MGDKICFGVSLIHTRSKLLILCQFCASCGLRVTGCGLRVVFFLARVVFYLNCKKLIIMYLY